MTFAFGARKKEEKKTLVNLLIRCNFFFQLQCEHITPKIFGGLISMVRSKRTFWNKLAVFNVKKKITRNDKRRAMFNKHN